MRFCIFSLYGKLILSWLVLRCQHQVLGPSMPDQHCVMCHVQWCDDASVRYASRHAAGSTLRECPSVGLGPCSRQDGCLLRSSM